MCRSIVVKELYIAITLNLAIYNMLRSHGVVHSDGEWRNMLWDGLNGRLVVIGLEDVNWLKRPVKLRGVHLRPNRGKDRRKDANISETRRASFVLQSAVFTFEIRFAGGNIKDSNGFMGDRRWPTP
jgi:hypothetical protein